MNKSQLVPQNDDELLDAFADLMAERAPDDPGEIDTLLREAGLDPVKIEAEVTALIAEARAKTPIDWRNRRQEMDTMSAKHQSAGNDLPSDHQGLLDFLQRLMSQPSTKMTYAHYRGREPEDLSIEELRSFIQDIRFTSNESLEDFEGSW
jgi:hypothetical protein